VKDGDVVIGLASPNLRSNGFSLVRSVFGDDLEPHLDRLLEPSVIYAPDVLGAVEGGGVHAAAHITGGGLEGNLKRVLPAGLSAEIDTTTWEQPPVFAMVAERGVEREVMFSTFNMGIGFCLVVEPGSVEAVTAATSSHGPKIIGEIVPGEGVGLG
jgi:phosphoribosylformylglycinamidine cyclo-ligase